VSSVSDRYSHLQQPGTQNTSLPKYLFALDLHQAKPVLPSLMGAIIETIKFLGYSNCALSVVEGRSTDGTLEVLASLQASLKDTGLRYTLQTSSIDPLATGNDRIQSLAALRNLALQPFVSQPHHFAANATVVFVNDVILCADDVLEIIHQHQHQAADVTCAMDWEYLGADPTFYDVWVARGMTGDAFFMIPEDGNWNSAWNLFWNDNEARDRLHAGLPFQVFSCWNGITAFVAEPLLEKEIAFRSANEKECFQGEPKLFCKDMWAHGHGKIMVVPSVNVAYTVEEAEKIKTLKGYVTKWASAENDEKRVAWKTDPPALVKCMPGYDHQIFIPWNEGIGT
jgi:alpha-1,3-mannosyltransferase